MDSVEKFIRESLEERQRDGILRQLKPESKLTDFCSNDYLGFARSPVLKQLIDQELNDHPKALNGSTGSRLLAGNSVYSEELEKEIALFHEAEAGLIFNSGYDANLGLFSSLPQKGDTIIHDELIHASIIDGARLSFASRFSFAHNNLESLENKLKNANGRCYVAIESVYSMDGDTPPISDMLILTERYGACLVVDEAHAVGLFGKGLIQQLGLQNRVFARLVTFGKALGGSGAVVLGSDLLRNYLINFARSFVYTTAAPFHHLAAVKMAYKLLTQSENDIDKLKENIHLFKQTLKSTNNYRLLPSDSAIQILVTDSNEKAKQLAGNLQQAGFDVRSILSPTVAKGAERIRICLHSFNSDNEVTLLTDTINKLIHA